MADEQWRRAERAWREQPGDQVLLERAIFARRRAGLAAPGFLLDRRILPARTFDTKLAASVFAERPDGAIANLGRTPREGGIAVPECRIFWIRPEPSKLTPKLLADLPANGAPGLSLERSHVDDAGLLGLSSIEQLRWLSLDTCTKITNAGVAALERLSNLETLDLAGCENVTGKGLAQVARLPLLARLRLSRMKHLKDADLEPLSRMAQLTRLDLLLCQRISDAGLAHLAKLSELTHLDLSYCRKIGDRGLASLAGLDQLRDLHLSSLEKITEASFSTLAGLPELASLNLHLCRGVTAGAIAKLAPLGKLERIVELTASDDHAAALSRLRHLTCLDLHSVLDVSGAVVTADFVATLAAELPDCRIVS